ncbi:YSIRK-type signal peptide-containing protein [uncultured Granulicatella sp.]|uniref:YSIRK-type signal peptide-containing protein n=1 Tax=uncultured Granulicatella sp. TaxID=316089 RepID=UPI0028D3D8B3|nr:YSIRK-type signal peptide-containing protein [uncultured Granulicatella sp.]
MKKIGSEKIQKYSLRKYKGIGAASVLLGMMIVGASPVLAEANTPKESTVTPAKDNVEMETLSNSAGSYTMPKMHVFSGLSYNGAGTEGGYEINHRVNEDRAKYNLDRVEKENIKKQGEDNFKDSRISYVTKEGEVLKEESDVEISVGDKKTASSTMNYKIRGLFGKRYEGNVANLNNDVLTKIKEADKVLEKNGEKYHKIDTVVDKHEGTTKETTFNDITVHANPGNLHNEDGSIRYNNIKEGSRVWLVSETDEGKYGKYVLATKPTTANDSWAVETFKQGENDAKDFTKENITTDGGIKEGDTILVVEKNEVALKDSVSTATEKAAYTAGAFFNENQLEEGLNNLLDDRLRDLKDEDVMNPAKEKTWEEIYKITLANKAVVDKKNRPTYSVHQEFNGYIRENGQFVEYHDVTTYIAKLKEMFGEKEITVGWKNSRDKVEPKFVGNIEEFKETANYESEKANVTKFKENHKAIQYVDRVPTNATFVKNVFEVNIDFKLGDKSTDSYYPSEDDDSNQPAKTYLAYILGYSDFKYSGDDTRFQYGLGQLYKEYEKDGVRYRITAPTKYDEHASVSAPIYSEIHYYNLYQPTRAYHVSDQLTNVKNIYAKEETETTENKGRVIVKYELADGTSIKETADVVKDAVISSTEAKYYLDKGNNKVIVGTQTTTNKEVLYDATIVKLPEIIKDGKKYKLVGLKEGSPAEKGNVGSGTTEITYVYKLATGGNVFEKYMLEGTTTEIAEGKVLKQDASLGEEYTSVAPKVGTLLRKDGKTYFYKEHRATSAPEIGTVDENEKTIIYDFVEYSSEKGEPEVQPELPEGIVSEKGEPEVQPALPEGVVSEKGELAIHPVAPLLITRHIIIGSNEELVPTEVSHFGPKQGMITKDSKQYQYESTHEEDGITTHYYKEMTSESHTNVPEGNGMPSSPSVEVEQSSEETIVSQQETTQNNTEEIHSNELPKTGQAELLPTWLGFLSLIGGVFVKRKNNKDNF